MADLVQDVETPLVQGTTVQQATNNTIKSLGDLIKLLPTGTYFLFTFLNPVFTNNGECKKGNKYLSAVFLALCDVASAFSWFTDSYIDSKGAVQYGLVTTKGIFAFADPDSGSVDLSKYKLRLGDFVHAFISLIVLAVVALWDPNTMSCFYPSFQSSEKTLIAATLPAVGVIAGSAFVMFPSNCYGIGYPARPTARPTVMGLDTQPNPLPPLS